MTLIRRSVSTMRAPSFSPTIWRTSTRRRAARTSSTARRASSGKTSGRLFPKNSRRCTGHSAQPGRCPIPRWSGCSRSIRRSGERLSSMRMPTSSTSPRSSRTATARTCRCSRAPRRNSGSGGSTTASGTWTRSTTPGTRSPTSFSSAATRRRMSRSRRMRTCTHP